MNTTRVFCGFLLCLLMTAGAFAEKKLFKEPEVDLSQFDFRSGDIVFQHLPSKLGSVICDVTNSPLSHCGMIVERKDELYVIEAIGPVRYISLKKWLKQGDKGRFMQMRVKDLGRKQLESTVEAAEVMLGRPYDIQYELDDEKIYCSELVYKAYLRGAEIEVGAQEELGNLNWQGNEDFIRAITGGSLPLE
ncbi:MAG TPA: YiiX/YebB-like N1pC/P60 family cysteine hydrolase, partial [Planctomycetaceae bacterium]